jgi:hypothetical protein
MAFRFGPLRPPIVDYFIFCTFDPLPPFANRLAKISNAALLGHFADGGDVVRPKDFVDFESARGVLIVANETADETFRGLTDPRGQVSKEFDEMSKSVRSTEVCYGT